MYVIVCVEKFVPRRIKVVVEMVEMAVVVVPAAEDVEDAEAVDDKDRHRCI